MKTSSMRAWAAGDAMQSHAICVQYGRTRSGSFRQHDWLMNGTSATAIQSVGSASQDFAIAGTTLTGT